MGFADMLFKLGIPYNSEEAIELAEKVMKFINDRSKEMSAELAKKEELFRCLKRVPYQEKGKLSLEMLLQLQLPQLEP